MLRMYDVGHPYEKQMPIKKDIIHSDLVNHFVHHSNLTFIRQCTFMWQMLHL